jgi:hypothetical protein
MPDTPNGDPEALEAGESEMAGGMPAAHGVSGKTFGEAVSGLAQTDPEALAEHVSSKPDTPNGDPEALEVDESDMAGGMPAAHGLTGEDFGAAVSGLAQTDPEALAEHVSSKPDTPNGDPEALEADESDMAGGMPAAHGLTGEDFGAAVSGLAQTDPEALVAHVSIKPDTPNSDPEAPEPDESDMAGGIPAAHSLAGEDFGEAVSGLAQTDPGALTEHVRSR